MAIVTYCIIVTSTGVCTQKFDWDDTYTYTPESGYSIPPDNTGEIGWTWSGSAWSAPTRPSPPGGAPDASTIASIDEMTGTMVAGDLLRAVTDSAFELLSAGGAGSRLEISGFGSPEWTDGNLAVNGDIDATGTLGVGGVPTTQRLLVTNNATTVLTDASIAAHIVGADATATAALIETFGATPALYFSRAQGTASTPTATANGNILGFFGARGYGATGYSSLSSARVQVRMNATEAWTDAAQGTSFTFWTTLTGTTTTAVRLTIDGLGNTVASGTVSDGAGNLRSVPQNAKTSAYTLAIGDNGEHISITTGGVTVPSGVFGIGDTVTIYNNSSASQTTTQGGSVTMYLVGTATTGNRTLAQRGLATILCVASNTFAITGGGLT